jgi:hypothetical protein
MNIQLSGVQSFLIKNKFNSNFLNQNFHLTFIIGGDNWYWRNARSKASVEIQSRLPEIELGKANQVV